MPNRAKKHVKKVTKTDEVPVEKDADVKKPKTDEENKFDKLLASFADADISINEKYLKQLIANSGYDTAVNMLDNTKKLRSI
jgi:hypothetical protein